MGWEISVMVSLVRLPIRSVLEFFDEAPEKGRGHTTAIIAVAGEEIGAGLLVDYYRRAGSSAEVLNLSCTQGTQKGHRLDRWIKVTRGAQATYYQVEIKNWSASAIGGRRIPVDADATQLRNHKIERWSREWDGQGFRKEPVRKVMVPMKSPVDGAHVEPLVCFWDAMHPQDLDNALFSVSLDLGPFSHVWVFSMSAHLRNLLIAGYTTVEINAPAIKARLKLLTALITAI
jgi:hypothetical protein